MIKNFLKIAFRQLYKQKFYTLINVAGLALSITCCLLIGLYVRHELSYDQHHENADNLYRLALDINLNQSVAKGTALPPPVAKTLKADFPEVVNAARLNRHFFNAGTNLMRLENEKESVYQEKFVYIDQEFTEMFNFPKIYGNPQNWLVEPQSVIITKKIADEFFPNTNPVGKNLILNDNPAEETYTITGVVENIPDNSHYDYDYFMSISTLGRSSNSDNWVFNNYFTYVQLKEGTNYKDLDAKLYDFGLRYFSPQFRERMNIDLAEAVKTGAKYNLFLQPLSEIHLHSDGFYPNLGETGDIRYVRMFGAVALFLLLIAIINFVNLSTARSANRAKEVGVRKVLGSMQKHLVGQFLVESILISVIAFVVALFFAESLLSTFNYLAGKDLSLPYTESWFLGTLLLGAVTTGCIAGLYPSFYLSGFSPIKVLKGKLSLGSKSSWLRQGLVVFQFAISTALIIGTLVVYHQMQFIQNKKLGFEKEQVLLIQDTYTLGEKVEAFQENLKNLPEVKDASVSAFLPLDGGTRNAMMFNDAEKTDPADQIPIQTWSVDENYINTLGMTLKSGRNFSADRPADSIAVILNETAVRQMGLTDPIGKRVKSPFMDDIYTVIGVVEDFNFETLKNEVMGLGLFLGRNTDVIAVKGNATDMSQLIAKTEQVWTTFAPNQALRYTFLDERFDTMYANETRAASLFNIFALIAIFIACLGLFALATFMAEQRTKEIGIRKILGSSVAGIAALLSKDFLKPVVIALLFGSPVAWYVMNKWLEDFVYRIDIAWWVFVIAGISAVGIALVTVSFQSVRAAMADPVESLRSE